MDHKVHTPSHPDSPARGLQRLNKETSRGKRIAISYKKISPDFEGKASDIRKINVHHGVKLLPPEEYNRRTGNFNMSIPIITRQSPVSATD